MNSSWAPSLCSMKSATGRCLPAIDMCAGNGIGRPGNNRFRTSTERELAPVVDRRLGEQPERPHRRQRVGAGQRLGVVVEIDEQGLAVAGLDETVGVSVEPAGHRPAVDVFQEVAGEHIDGEVGHRSSLRRREIGGITEPIEHAGRLVRSRGVIPVAITR
jgi:hypothetical protein